MASTDGDTSSDPAREAATGPGGRRARTAAEQRHEAATTSNDPEVLAAEIEKTREELAETLDAIADKVSPKRVAGRTKKKVGDAVKEGAESATASVKAGAESATATVKAGAGTLKEAVQEKKDALQDKVAGSDSGTGSGSVADTLETVGVAPEPVPAGGTTGGSVAQPGLRTVPSTGPYGATAGSSLRLGPPAVAGALTAVTVVLLVLRRRRNRSRWG